MICQNCLKGGEENTLSHYKRATNWHDKCDYKGCVCQHKTGPGHTKVSQDRMKLTQSQ